MHSRTLCGDDVPQQQWRLLAGSAGGDKGHCGSGGAEGSIKRNSIRTVISTGIRMPRNPVQ